MNYIDIRKIIVKNTRKKINREFTMLSTSSIGITQLYIDKQTNLLNYMIGDPIPPYVDEHSEVDKQTYLFSIIDKIKEILQKYNIEYNITSQNLYEHKRYLDNVIKLQLTLKRDTIVKNKLTDGEKEYLLFLIDNFLTMYN